MFPHLSVMENLRVLRYTPPEAPARAAVLERARVRSRSSEERRRQHAGTLSGGEQQMLALARVGGAAEAPDRRRDVARARAGPRRPRLRVAARSATKA